MASTTAQPRRAVLAQAAILGLRRCTMSGSGSFARQLQWGGHGGSFSHLKETLERSFVKPSFLHVFLFPVFYSFFVVSGG